MEKNNDKALVFFASLLAMLYLWASDMYLPAFNDMSRDLLTSEAKIGYSLSIYFLAFAFSQVFFGSVSDQLGRRPMLIIGAVIFILGSFVCMISGSIFIFYTGRILMAVGACSAFVLWQAIIVDSFSNSEKVHKTFAFGYMLLGVSPAMAPVMGGVISSEVSWRFIFLVLAAYGLLILIISTKVYKETLSVKSPFSLNKLIHDYSELLSNRRFLTMSMALGLLCGIYMTYITLTPFVFGRLGYSNSEIGFTLVPIAITFIFGNRIAVYLANYWSIQTIIFTGMYVSILATITMLITTVVFPFEKAVQLIAPMSLITFCNGLSIPFGMSSIVKENEHISGTCSSALGFFISIIPFILVMIGSSIISDIGVLAISAILIPASMLAVAFAWVSRSCPIKHEGHVNN